MVSSDVQKTDRVADNAQVNPRIVILAVTVALGAIPATATAQDVAWRCTAAPISGTVLGQRLQTPSVGSTTGECTDDATLPTLTLPDPLQSLVSVDLLNGKTITNDQGVFAGAGLLNLQVGKLPITLPQLQIPDNLKKIEVTLPNMDHPVASVDLTPAIDAINALPSKPLLDLGTLYSTVTGSCDGTTPAITGSSRVLNADILGLTVDSSHVVDTAVSLIDTKDLALNTLNTKLVDITILDKSVNATVSDILNALDPVLDQLPPIGIPEQIARVKLTPNIQETVDGMLTQTALRAEVTLGGQSIADLSIGKAAVGAGTVNCAPEPEDPALACTDRKLALIDVLPDGDRVKLFGAANKDLVGRTVDIVFSATGQTVARVKVGKDGHFSTTAPMPGRDVRYTNQARYVAKVGGERSLNLKLNRRMIVGSVKDLGDKVRIRGHVILPLGSPVQPIIVKRRVDCGQLKRVGTFKPRPNGTFNVLLNHDDGIGTTYRLQTKVRNNLQNPKLFPTFTLPRAVDFF
ncbi:MAG: hypothetical protein QOF76_4182 [Solirubrobacteraceae bacterium]|jgi:hypothetical protein|nr:hypothetical protein [Solirubrobacteraceae bacterium]